MTCCRVLICIIFHNLLSFLHFLDTCFFDPMSYNIFEDAVFFPFYFPGTGAHIFSSIYLFWFVLVTMLIFHHVFLLWAPFLPCWPFMISLPQFLSGGKILYVFCCSGGVKVPSIISPELVHSGRAQLCSEQFVCSPAGICS